MWSNDHRPNSRLPHRRSGGADTSDISGTWTNYSTTNGPQKDNVIQCLPVVNAVRGQSRTVAIGSPTNEACASSNSQLFLAVALSQARVQRASVIELGPRPRALLVAFHPLQNWLEGGEGGSSGRGRSDPSRSTRRRQKPPLPSARTEASTADEVGFKGFDFKPTPMRIVLKMT